MYQYFAFYKPYGYLSQFTDEGRWKGLHHILDLAKDIYPIGRLDADSEGLLLLTNNGRLNKAILNPKHAHEREYWIQVEGIVKRAQLKLLMEGVQFKAKGKTYTGACKAVQEIPEPDLEERIPPIRFRKTIPTSWISLTLTEGKNRQVRKMTAAAGLPCLRLIRHRIEDIIIPANSGDISAYSELEFKKLLHL